MLDAQTGGALAVIGAFAASEAAPRLLDAYPGSAFAWYLNLELFRPFAFARAEISPLSVLFGPTGLFIDLALLGLILVFRMARFRFGVAFFANLSFGIAMALAHAWLRGAGAPKTASLVEIGARPVSEGLLVGTLLAASFAAFAISHLSFVIAVGLSRGERAVA